MKFLPPSMREKARYMVFEVIPIKEENNKNNNMGNVHFSFSDISNSLLPVLKNFFGELTLGESNFWFLPKMWYPNRNVGVIRIDRNYLEHVKAGLLFVDRIKDKRVILKSLLVSGSLKKIRKLLNTKENKENIKFN